MTLQEPTIFIVCTPETDADEDVTSVSERDQLRAELRQAFNSSLVKITGRPGARMRYSAEHYAQIIVIEYGLTLPTWPKHIWFGNLSDAKLGGIASLRELHRRWFSTEGADRLRFEPASDEEIAAARVDPLNVHPTRDLFLKHAKGAVMVTDQDAPILMPSVHHPLGLVPLGLHPTPTQPGATTASVQGKDKRKQRCDVKRRRVCKRIENDLRKLPPKRGVTSRKLVLRITSVPNFVGLEDSRAEALEMAVDDPVDEFLPLDLSELVEGEDDPIEEFLSTDECSGMSSEIEGIEPASDWD